MATSIQLMSQDEANQIVSRVANAANGLVIQNDDHMEMAASMLNRIDDRLKWGDETFDPNIDAAHKAHKAAIAVKRTFTDPLQEAKKIIKSKMVGYTTECERKREEEQRRLEAEAKQAADDAALAEAAELASRGEQHLAEVVLQSAAEAAPAALAPASIAKPAGITTTKVWKWTYQGDPAEALKELVQAAAKDDRLLGYLAHNTQAIGATVKAQKSLTRIPRIKVWSENDVRSTGRR
jgi:uncharacterized protein YbjQ (UPF0145 family)